MLSSAPGNYVNLQAPDFPACDAIAELGVLEVLVSSFRPLDLPDSSISMSQNVNYRSNLHVENK